MQGAIARVFNQLISRTALPIPKCLIGVLARKNTKDKKPGACINNRAAHWSQSALISVALLMLFYLLYMYINEQNSIKVKNANILECSECAIALVREGDLTEYTCG